MQTEYFEITFFPNGAFMLSQIDYSGSTPIFRQRVNLSPSQVDPKAYADLLFWLEVTSPRCNTYSCPSFSHPGFIVTYALEV